MISLQASEEGERLHASETRQGLSDMSIIERVMIKTSDTLQKTSESVTKTFKRSYEKDLREAGEREREMPTRSCSPSLGWDELDGCESGASSAAWSMNKEMESFELQGTLGSASPPRHESGLDRSKQCTWRLNLKSLGTLTPELAEKVMELLWGERNHDAEGLSREEFIRSIVHFYLGRESLSLSLKDYESILGKLSLIVASITIIVWVFVGLWIFDQDVSQLGVAAITLLVGISFMIGTSVTALVESCVFIFITHAYDVGDRVYLKADSGNMLNLQVETINLLSTVFKQWDNKSITFPNQRLAQMEIQNMRRSGPVKLVFESQVSNQVTHAQIDALQTKLRSWAKRQGSLTIQPDTIGIFISDIKGMSAVSLCYVYMQTENGQDNDQLWANRKAFLKQLVKYTHQLGIKSSTPALEVNLADGGSCLPHLVCPTSHMDQDPSDT
ncbi:unnamed protein product [Chrysoparadoxa australica]